MALQFKCHFTILLVIALSGCRSSGAAHHPPPTKQDPPSLEPVQTAVQPIMASQLFVEGDSLSYNCYQIIKLKKEVDHRDWCSSEERNKPCLIPVHYTVIERDSRILAKFDDFYYGLGNLNDFGLYPLLGSDEKQLIISQTGPRSGRHYVVDLHARPRILFDSGDYEVGREEVEILDLDKDGVYEISLAVTAFYMVFDISMAETPLPVVIFKYDPKARKYLPANHLFQMKPLDRVEEKRSSKKRRGEGAGILRILLDCIYAGKEEAGWSYFEREYNLADKHDVKARVLRVLKKATAYKYIRDHRK